MIEISEMYLASQGEGPNLGRPSLFVRTRRCTLRCAWCDSKFSWDENDPGFRDYEVYASPALLADAMLACSQNGSLCRAVVVTGGEPLIWQRQLHEALLLYRRSCAYVPPIEVETSGTVMPSVDMLRLCNFNVSHKLASAGNVGVPRERLWREDVVRAIISADGLVLNNISFKPVLSPTDFGELKAYLDFLCAVGAKTGLSWSALRARVYLMPQAATANGLMIMQGYIMALAQAYGVRCTTRLQVLAYGNTRRT